MRGVTTFSSSPPARRRRAVPRRLPFRAERVVRGDAAAADGALSAEVRAAVDRAGCGERDEAHAADPEPDDAAELAWTHLAAAAATLFATVGGMCWLGTRTGCGSAYW